MNRTPNSVSFHRIRWTVHRIRCHFIENHSQFMELFFEESTPNSVNRSSNSVSFRQIRWTVHRIRCHFIENHSHFIELFFYEMTPNSVNVSSNSVSLHTILIAISSNSMKCLGYLARYIEFDEMATIQLWEMQPFHRIRWNGNYSAVGDATISSMKWQCI